jgi:prolipoprotein diacylglyceryltransferase
VLWWFGIRLTVGWTWEVFFVKLLLATSSSKHYNKQEFIYFNFWNVISIVIMSWIIHVLVRNVDQKKAKRLPHHQAAQERQRSVSSIPSTAEIEEKNEV